MACGNLVPLMKESAQLQVESSVVKKGEIPPFPVLKSQGLCLFYILQDRHRLRQTRL